MRSSGEKGTRLPGVYLLRSSEEVPSGFRQLGGLYLGACGEGSEVVVQDDLAVAQQRLGDSEINVTAAEVLQVYRNDGSLGLASDAGARIIVIDNRKSHPVVHVRSAPRASYLYRRGEVLAIAPSPVAFALAGRPCFMDRQGMFETCLTGATPGTRTAIREIDVFHRCSMSGGEIDELALDPVPGQGTAESVHQWLEETGGLVPCEAISKRNGLLKKGALRLLFPDYRDLEDPPGGHGGHSLAPSPWPAVLERDELLTNLVRSSLLARDNHFGGAPLHAVRKLVARAPSIRSLLRSLLRLEIAYRLFVDGQAPSSITTWLESP